MRHEPAPLQAQKVSGPAQPEFRWERFSAIAHDLPPLFARHWREIALNQDFIPLAPDFDRYYALDLQGILRILTVRHEGLLVGYAFLLFGPHLHYATTPYGHGDMFWIDPLYRQGWTGVKLFKELIRGTREMGGAILQLSIKLHFENGRVAKLLTRLGFHPVETMYALRL